MKENKVTHNLFESAAVKNISETFFNHIVTIFFVFICIVGIILANQPISFVLREVIVRLARNAVLVLSLIIPVLAGIGLNFGIVLGAMAGQVALIMITHWNVSGVSGMIASAVISTPIAILLGYFTGKILNKTKGQEMITGMILGFFSIGIYDFIFLILVGKIIPMNNPELILSSGVGIKNTIELQAKTKYALDSLLKISLYDFILWAYGMVMIGLLCHCAYTVYKQYKFKQQSLYHKTMRRNIVLLTSATAIMAVCALNQKINMAVKYADVPVATFFVITVVCLSIRFITNTKLGQDLRSVGQNMYVANASGINVNRLRIIAIIISTVLAAWGQLIFIQNIGNFNTYSTHEQVGVFAIAALLVGGASISKATMTQAIIGIVLFHTLFVVSPIAGKNVFDNAQVGEYFRVFIAYGVIAVSLGLHAWKKKYGK